ncbi:MAG: RHS repeat-associated core domain-containing protein, partial [Rudaea sp.]
KTPQATYNYNGKGERVIKAVGTVGKTLTPTTFVYSESGQLLGEYNTSGNKEYIQLDSIPVGLVTISGSTAQLYYLETDHLGTPRQAIKPGSTPASDTLVWKWDYFGSAFGTNAPNPQTLTANLRFPGQYFDSETGLNYNYFRDYEPGTGRYVESDPIGEYGGVNTYAFVGNDPLTGIDPYGLIKIYGNWCGPDWTGGYKKPWNDLTQYERKHIKPPIDQLDGACKDHDLCYGKCGIDSPCDLISRSRCFRRCDHILTDAAYHVGGFWGFTVGAAIDRPGERDPGGNATDCCAPHSQK